MNKPNLVFMFGDDDFSIQQELSRWTRAFVQKHGDMNLEKLAGNSSPSEVLQHITSPPFLGEKRLVVLQNFQNTHKAETKKELVPVLEKLPDETVLVLLESPTPDKRSSLYKWLQKNGTLKNFDVPKGYELTQWILKQFGPQGNTRAAQALLQKVGPNTWRLHHEIEKLKLFAGEASITPDMVEELVHGSIEQSIFTLTDQLAHRDHKGALKTLRLLQEQGQPGPYLFAMIARQFRIMAEMKAHAEKGLSESGIAKAMGIHPFVAKKTLPHCRNFTAHQLGETLKRLLDIDRRMKTGGLHMRTGDEEQYLLAIESSLLRNN